MAMPPGTLKWGTLATMSNDAVYQYFRTVRKQDKDYAFNSLRKVRAMYFPTGARRPKEEYVPRDFWTPDNESPDNRIPPEGIPMPTEELPLDKPRHAPTHNPLDNKWRTETEPDTLDPIPLNETETKDMAPSSDAASALYEIIKPAMAAQVSAEIAKAVAKIHAEMAPVKQLVILKDKLETVLDGQHHTTAPKVLQLVNQGLNVMMVGPAGCGKTMLAETVAKALGRELTIVSCSAGMSEAQLLGRLLPLGEGGAFKYVESPFMKSYVKPSVILLDEIDASDANLLLVINAALANGGITVEARAASHENTYVKRHPECVILAAANTWGHGADTQYVGRGALDVSTLDRFKRIDMDYDPHLECQLGTVRTISWVHNVRKQARAAKLRRVVSTRMITRIEKSLAAGQTFDEATSDELASWSADERSKVA